MRLIDAKTQELCDFTLLSIPPYAILSHTWGPEEITYHHMNSHDPRRLSMQGYDKITQSCRLTLSYGLDYVWIDTCCIDKSNSAELTESINSMFAYYRDSEICIIHLVDCPSNAPDIRSCRWFTRGWTLQELLAPKRRAIYDQTWSYVDIDPAELLNQVQQETRIPLAVLMGERSIHEYSVATRMSWAANRSTTRTEDIAYCLLGIFDINMPLIYGEGLKAFRRLQEEILKRNNDLSILAWEPPHRPSPGPSNGAGMCLLAQSPLNFRQSEGIEPFTNDFPELSVTNKGLYVSPDIPLRIISAPGIPGKSVIGLCLGSSHRQLDNGRMKGSYVGGIVLRKIGPGLFCRHEAFSLMGFDYQIDDLYWPANSSGYHIVIDPNQRSLGRYQESRDQAIFVSHQEDFQLTQVSPESLWDPEDQVFLRPRPIDGLYYPQVMAMVFSSPKTEYRLNSFIVICVNLEGNPQLGIVKRQSDTIANDLFFRGAAWEKSILWEDFDEEVVGIDWMEWAQAGRGGTKTTVCISNTGIGVQASFTELPWDPIQVEQSH